jgi:GntR family transcriptional regulator, transcriptional repressor for pyruvate dehydrogenase complex
MARKAQGQREVSEFELVPIEKVDVFRSVVGQLDAMVSKLQPGDSLGSERELAERLSVSRVSVREALRALQSMGKIEIRRNAGSFVVDPGGKMLAPLLTSSRPIDEGFIRDLVDVREAIETRVVALVAARPPAELAPAREALALAEREMAANGAEGQSGSLDLRFEAGLGAGCGNLLLTRVQRAVHALWIDAAIELGIEYGDRATLHAQHVAILEALEAGEGDRAVRLMAEHVHQVKHLAT